MSDANGVALDNPIDLEGRDGKEYTVKGDIEIVYTNERNAVPVVLKKVGVNNTDDTQQEYDLEGATFTIYTTVDGNTIATDVDGDELKNLVSGEDGVFYEGSLNPGTYYLYESHVPDGHYAPLGRFKLEVDPDATTLTATWITGAVDGAAGTVSERNDANTGIKTYTVSVQNISGVALPEAGGSGTLGIYLAGCSMLVLACVSLLRQLKRD